MREATAPQQFTPPFPPLALVNKPNLTTGELAYYLDRRPQTLRGWACLENGPLRPVRINGRLAWPVSELRRVLGVTA
ncbi:MAG: DNA-binding protein [Polaromonas sp.]|nr:DNA-binding protein [Polaromonas sp.]